MRAALEKQLFHAQPRGSRMKGKHSKPAPMGYRDGGKVKGFMPCMDCKSPRACKAAGKCMAGAKAR